MGGQIQATPAIPLAAVKEPGTSDNLSQLLT